MVGAYKLCLLRCGLGPVAGIRHSQDSGACDDCGDEHRFIARQDCLANGNWTTGLVLAGERTGTVIAIWLFWEWLLDLTVLVAK